MSRKARADDRTASRRVVRATQTGRSRQGGKTSNPRHRPAPGPSEPTAPRRAPRLLYLLSDSTGNLPRHMAAAFLTQFPEGAFTVRARGFLDTPDKLEAAFDEIRSLPGIVMHALVEPAMKGRAAAMCAGLGIAACDLTGPFVEFLAAASGLSPTPSVGRLHGVDEAYRRRVKAVEFALEHDDGLGLESLHDADVVLVGVSRTSKTPTCVYLAQQGIKAGNVSLAMGVEPPAELLALPKQKVAALVIDPRQLVHIRARRQDAWRMPDTSYNSPASVEAEVEWSRRLFARAGWATYDVTDHAIEETAARIADRIDPARLPRRDGAP